MSDLYHPDNDRVIPNQLIDPESFVINPRAQPGAVDAKPALKLKDLYPDIDEFRVLPASVYTDPALRQKEWDRLWTQTWLYAGHVSDLRQPGDWFRFDIGRESIIVARSPTGMINAFYNACRHRGTRLVTDDFGSSPKGFMCPFHGWRYDIQGKNIRVVDRNTFAPETLCDVNLGRVRSEVWNGLVFIHMGEDAEPLADYLGDVAHFMAPYKMEELHTVKEAQYTMLANWKATIDAFQEAYHAQTTHPEFKQYVEEHFLQYDFYRNGHNRQLTPFVKVSHRLKERENITPFIADALTEAGIDLATFKGGPEEARRAIQQAKRRPDNPFGVDYSGFTDEQLTDDWNVTVFPNITLNSHPEGVLIMRFRPHPTDPEKSFYDAQILMRKTAGGARPPRYMGVDPEVDISGATRPKRVYLESDQAAVLGAVLEQDASNLPKVQAGLHSRGLHGVVNFSEQERRIQQFFAEWSRYLNTKDDKVV